MAMGSAGWGALSDRIGAGWTCLIGALLLGAGLELGEHGADAGRIPIGVRAAGGSGHFGDLRASHSLRDRLVRDAAEPGGITGVSGVRGCTVNNVAVGSVACVSSHDWRQVLQIVALLVLAVLCRCHFWAPAAALSARRACGRTTARSRHRYSSSSVRRQFIVLVLTNSFARHTPDIIHTVAMP